MRGHNVSVILISSVFLAMCMSGCAGAGGYFKEIIGTSTKVLYDGRKNAMAKVFDYDYKTCYAKTEKILKEMANVSVYAKNDELIAIYYTAINTTPVGIFFKKIDSARTQVEISSPSMTAKEWVAKNVFSETVQAEPPRYEL